MPVKPQHRSVDSAEFAPGIRKYVYDFCLLNDRLLKTLIKAGITFSAVKSYIGVSSIAVVGHVCNQVGRSPSEKNVAKILDWNKFENVTHIRGFLGAADFFRI